MATDEFVSQIKAIINHLIFLEKKKNFIFEGISLYPSEIHLMLETKGEQAVNATKIADKLGISKGAVSQTLARLEKKGIIKKIKDPNYKNELSIFLTPLGKRAYDQYQILCTAIIKHFCTIISHYSEDEQKVIKRFLSDFKDTLEHM
jgi:DNA-binding MarR family transcriptional regulator